MKKTLEARYKAQKQTLITLKKFKDNYSSIPILVQAVDMLSKSIEQARQLMIAIESVPQRTAANKDLAREELAAIALKIGNVLKVYSNLNHDKNLYSQLVTSENLLSHQMRQQELLNYCNSIKETVEKDPQAIEPYGATATLIEEFKKEIDEFALLISEPRHLVNERKTNNELLAESIVNAGRLLNDQIDPLMELFIDDQQFYLEYKSARMIVDPASHHHSKE